MIMSDIVASLYRVINFIVKHLFYSNILKFPVAAKDMLNLIATILFGFQKYIKGTERKKGFNLAHDRTVHYLFLLL
jgi:hypothetical protein